MIGCVVDYLAFKTTIKSLKLASPEKAVREKKSLSASSRSGKEQHQS
jgi:hypothetical protein